MSDELSEEVEATVDAAVVPPCEGPPLAERPAVATPDPRGELLRMAASLARSRNDRLLVEYLRLRRAAG